MYKTFLINQLKVIEEHMITFKKLRDDYTTSHLLDCNCFNKYYKMMAIDFSKEQALDADPKTIQQINFTGNLNHFRFFVRNLLVLRIYFALI